MLNLEELLKFITAMNREEVEYIAFGAVAMWAHGIVRATEDADFFVAPTPENVERLKRALRAMWDDPAIAEISAEDLMGDYPAVRYGPPDTAWTFDFLTRLGEVYPYEKLRWQMSEIEGTPIRVVTPAQLYEMKRNTVRAKDRMDAEALRQEYSLPED
jgi:hypothetical protein